MSDVFSTPAEHALSHPDIDAIHLHLHLSDGPSRNGDAQAELSVEQAFEVEDTVRIVLDGGYKTVRLVVFPSVLDEIQAVNVEEG